MNGTTMLQKLRMIEKVMEGLNSLNELGSTFLDMPNVDGEDAVIIPAMIEDVEESVETIIAVFKAYLDEQENDE